MAQFKMEEKMKEQTLNKLVAVVVFLVCLCITAPQAGADNNASYGNMLTTHPPANDVRFSSSRILVRFKMNSAGPSAVNEGPSLPENARKAIAGINGRIVKTFAKAGVHVVDVPESSVGRAIEALYRSKTVVYAEPDYQVRTLAVPNDPRFAELWGLHNTGGTGTADADIDAPEGWNAQKFAGTVIVGVVDTGIDYNHEDLAANIWANPGEIAGNGIDDDGNGWVDDVRGIDVYNLDGDPMDDNSHGTHVAGTIGARGNNGVGVVGVAWQTKLMALKFLDIDGSGWTSDAIACIDYFIDIMAANSYTRGILSNSWGGGGYSQALYDAIKAARDAGVLFVAAAGNDGMNTDLNPGYPSTYDLDNIISVGASDSYDGAAWFSNFGKAGVDLFAPGVSILSSTPGNTYSSYSGTSMATPHVSGVAALIWARYPTSSWWKIKAAVLNGVDFPAAFADLSMTGGRLNLQKSLLASTVVLPAIFKVNPNAADLGDAVTIIGAQFGTVQGTVNFKGLPLNIVSWAPGRIVARVPANNSYYGTGKLTVTTSASKTSTGGAVLTIAHLPVKIGETILGHGWASSAQVGNDLFIMGGSTYWGQTGLVERCTLGTPTRCFMDSDWIMPVPLANTGAAASGGKIYVAGGMDWNTGGISDAIQIFDISSETWSAGNPIPQPLIQPTVFERGGKIYVVGGFNAGDTTLNTVYIYNPAANSWSTGAAKPTATAFAGSAPLGATASALIMGGFSGPRCGDEQNVVEEYNTSTNIWTSRPAMNAARGGMGSLYYNGSYALMGNCGSLRTDGEVFSAGAWAGNLQGTQTLYTPMAGKRGIYGYILNGYDFGSSAYSRNIWRFKP
jgi:subtilisin family serine protease